MTSRTTTTFVAFAHPFELAGCPAIMPVGQYTVIAEDELIANLTFEAFRRTSTLLMWEDHELTQLFPINQEDLDLAYARDCALSSKNHDSMAALSPPEEEI